MRIVCVGGGPAGLYFAICAKRRNPDHEITVLERDPAGATHGWGVAYWEPLIDNMFHNDPVCALAVQDAAALWQEHRLAVGTRTAYLPGHGYGIQRSVLLDVFARRATELGVRLHYRQGIVDEAELRALCAENDLVVAADGGRSQVRRLAGTDVFGTRLEEGLNPYIWLGTDQRFTDFRFAFQRTPHGWIWFHAYPSASDVGTCVFECAPTTWTGLGLDRLDDAAGRELLETIFADQLAGHRLLGGGEGDRGTSRPAHWQRFTHVSNRSWRHDNIVLIGDAAHTTHFTFGSGTALAMMDAVMLARFLRRHDGDLPAALTAFDTAGRKALGRVQAHARRGSDWFERIDDLFDNELASPQDSIDGPDPVTVAAALSSRHGGGIQPLRRRVLRSNQVPAVRRVRREASTGGRWLRERRRARELTRAG
ncbi:FAD-dependent monooxygenase [Pseudofrankia inefficax]|uniref:Monooxygenase FAD-binding protein n=1 Tax=Pseudofrankia inefficax (strain DSM 45817 / CECT 9037 / DDB 130130 / EuI1c) TaxID=298654 RepID=E3J7C8_PSEI1|nr:FAD-dependent monooxygenase [Pseudofrankia inefficax]ADP78401.1 monooxygenase FAD-binding protein [Pseudofrankia inefficax]